MPHGEVAASRNNVSYKKHTAPGLLRAQGQDRWQILTMLQPGMIRGGKVLTGVGHGDLADLIGVEPHIAPPTLEDARGKRLLKLQRHHRSLPLDALSLLRTEEGAAWLFVVLPSRVSPRSNRNKIFFMHKEWLDNILTIY